jgi:hypothetical protein
MLLRHGANPNARSMETTPLLCAVSNHYQSEGLSRLLIDAGADPNAPGKLIRLTLANTYHVDERCRNVDIVPLAAIRIGQNYRLNPQHVAELLVRRGARMDTLCMNNQDVFSVMSLMNRVDIFTDEAQFANLLRYYIENGCTFTKAGLQGQLHVPNAYNRVIDRVEAPYRRRELALALASERSTLNRETLNGPSGKVLRKQWTYGKDPFRKVFGFM